MENELRYPIPPRTMTVLAGVIGLTACALQVGTGGAQTAEYYKQRGPKGYAFVVYDMAQSTDGTAGIRAPTENLSHIRAVLKPAITDLAHALNVSRQAVYDWQSGKPIAADNAARLADLARAADLFAAEGLTASAQLLRRPIAPGKRLFDIARDGGSAEDAALKLIQIVRRELHQRQLLAARLAGRKRPAAPLDDYGAPSSDEWG
jgi:hypothetical protein